MMLLVEARHVWSESLRFTSHLDSLTNAVGIGDVASTERFSALVDRGKHEFKPLISACLAEVKPLQQTLSRFARVVGHEIGRVNRNDLEAGLERNLLHLNKLAEHLNAALTSVEAQLADIDENGGMTNIERLREEKAHLQACLQQLSRIVQSER